MARVREPMPGVFWCLRYMVKIDHVGVYLGEGKFIHATEHSGTCIEHISKYVPRLKHIYERKE